MFEQCLVHQRKTLKCFLTFFSYLVLQDNPDQGVLYMLRGLLNVMENFQWDPNQDTKAMVYSSVLSLLSAASQETYIYHADRGLFGFNLISCTKRIGQNRTAFNPPSQSEAFAISCNRLKLHVQCVLAIFRSCFMSRILFTLFLFQWMPMIQCMDMIRNS